MSILVVFSNTEVIECGSESGVMGTSEGEQITTCWVGVAATQII